jgi:hypothetical protein
MLDSDPSKQREKANAIFVVINNSDIEEADFDETLLHRATAICTTLKHRPDSTHHVNAQSLWCQRHAAMGRHSECADACLELLAMAAAPRMAQSVCVQQMAHEVKNVMRDMRFHGLI